MFIAKAVEYKRGYYVVWRGAGRDIAYTRSADLPMLVKNLLQIWDEEILLNEVRYVRFSWGRMKLEKAVCARRRWSRVKETDPRHLLYERPFSVVISASPDTYRSLVRQYLDEH